MTESVHKIEDGLWLGDKHMYSDPELNSRFQTIVTAMLNAEVSENNIKEKVAGRTWLHVPVDDDYREDISKHFLSVIEFIDVEREKGNTVYVHCAGGISRSPTLIAAYLMWEHTWTRRQAIEHIVAQRKIVDPNDGFMDQLLMFERVLEKSNSSTKRSD